MEIRQKILFFLYDARFSLRILPPPEPAADIFTVFSKQSAAAYRKKYEAASEELGNSSPYEKLLEEFINK